jgi:redox-sensitive bicupin YhaK (pirin superfamily)
MKTRTVSHLLYGEVVSMGGMPIRQPFPTQNVEQIDPFLLLHHHRTTAGEPFEGVGPHPHRGFSPVSFIFEGSLRHQDSRGNDSVISAGGIQWMNSGMGIIHSERPVDVEADLELIQLWINTPAAHKMDQPVYIPVTAEEAGLFKSDDGLVSAKIFAGEVLGTKGKVKALSPVNAATFDVKKGGKISIPLPADHNAFIYLLDGVIKLEGYGLVEGKNAVVFKKDGDSIAFEATENTRILFMTGKPLDEKVVSYGPFVMNSQTQIMEAMRDYQIGKMGVLIEA